jgi:hypothetical protein
MKNIAPGLSTKTFEIFCQGLLLQVQLPEEGLVKEIYDHYPLFLLQEKSANQVTVIWNTGAVETLLSETQIAEIHKEKNFSVYLEEKTIHLFCPLRIQQGFDDFYSWCRRHRHLFYKV